MTRIKYVKGSLLEAPELIILHGCNSLGVMGAGVAAAIRSQWPKAYKDYKERHQGYGLELGSIIQSKQPDGKIIMNAITQSTIGNSGTHVSYWAIATIMHRLNDIHVVREVGSVAMPMIGSGLAGGDWDVIAAIIENTVKSFQPIVYKL